MKRITIYSGLSLLFLVTFTKLNAQRSAGVRGGLTISNFSNPEQLGLAHTNSKKDYTLGYFIEFRLKQKYQQESNVVFQTGMTFERRGLNSNGFDEEVGTQVDDVLTLKYFSIPLLLKGGPGDQDIFNLILGPELSILYLATREKDYTTYDIEKEADVDQHDLIGITRDYKSIDLSITGGFSIDIPLGERLRIPIDFRVGKSLMDIRRNPSRFDDSAKNLIYKFNTGIVLYY